MAYPARSDFTSSVPYAAWFYDRSQARRVCATDAWSFVGDLRYELFTRLDDAPGKQLPTYNGQPVAAASVMTDPQLGLDPELWRVLWAVAKADGAPQAHLDDVRAASDMQAVTLRALQTAVWAAYQNRGVATTGNVYGRFPVTNVELPANTLAPPPVFVPAAPATGTETRSGLNCTVVPVDQPNLTPTPPAPPPQAFQGWPILAVGGAVLVGFMLLSQINPARKVRR